MSFRVGLPGFSYTWYEIADLTGKLKNFSGRNIGSKTGYYKKQLIDTGNTSTNRFFGIIGNTIGSIGYLDMETIT